MHVETLNDAIRAAIDAAGGPKRVGSVLWSELGAEAAGNRLRDCLNPTRRERLSPEQLALVRRMARDAGCHVLASFEAKESGYARPVPIAPDDEKAELMRAYVEAVRKQQELTQRLEVLAWGGA